MFIDLSVLEVLMVIPVIFWEITPNIGYKEVHWNGMVLPWV